MTFRNSQVRRIFKTERVSEVFLKKWYGSRNIKKSKPMTWQPTRKYLKSNFQLLFVLHLWPVFYAIRGFLWMNVTTKVMFVMYEGGWNINHNFILTKKYEIIWICHQVIITCSVSWARNLEDTDLTTTLLLRRLWPTGDPSSFFFDNGMKKIPVHWEKCVMKSRDSEEKWGIIVYVAKY